MVRSRRALQVTLGIVAAFPLVGGVLETLAGPWVLPGHPSAVPDVDSQYRFFAAMFLGSGLLLLWIIPRVERATGPLQAVAALYFFGAIGRVISMLTAGKPHLLIVLFTVTELVLPPILVTWQLRVAAARSPESAVRPGR